MNLQARLGLSKGGLRVGIQRLRHSDFAAEFVGFVAIDSGGAEGWGFEV